MPPSKIPSLIPPVLSIGSNAHPTSDRGNLTSLSWRWIAIGVGGIAAAALIGIAATTVLRSRRPSAAIASTAGDTPSVSPASSDEPSPLASSVSRSNEKEPPTEQAPQGESVATTASERPTRFAPGTAKRALDSKRPELTKCRRGKAWGYGLATVTFGNDGSVDKVALAPPLAGTLTGECAKGTLVAARIAPFVGSPRSVAYKFYVAPK